MMYKVLRLEKKSQLFRVSPQHTKKRESKLGPKQKEDNYKKKSRI
jgi:hypothetical protein